MTLADRLRQLADQLDATHDIWDGEARLVRQAAAEIHRLTVEATELRALNAHLFETCVERIRQEPHP